jgi:hypothetical protein
LWVGSVAPRVVVPTVDVASESSGEPKTFGFGEVEGVAVCDAVPGVGTGDVGWAWVSRLSRGLGLGDESWGFVVAVGEREAGRWGLG